MGLFYFWGLFVPGLIFAISALEAHSQAENKKRLEARKVDKPVNLH